MTRRLLLPALLVLLAAPAARGEESGPQATLQGASERVQRLLAMSSDASDPGADLDGDLGALIDELLDLDRMARDALGEHWGEATASQRDEYRSLLRRLVWQAAFQRAHAGVDYTMQVGAASVDVRRSRIETVIAVSTPGREGRERRERRERRETVFIAFHMERGDGGWRIVELEVDGVHLVRSYRLQFHRIIVGWGFDELLRRMRERLGDR